MTTFNRREFLASLLAVGATITIGVPLAQASTSQVDVAWKQLLDDPWYFEVDEYGTITQPGVEEPKTKGDVFDIWVEGIKTPDDLVDAVERCWPLTGHFQELSKAEHDDILSSLEHDDLSPAKKRALQRLEAAMQDVDEGWKEWALLGGRKGVPGFRDIIEDWLLEPIEWEDMAHFPRDHGGQGQALAFFEDLPFETLVALGVVIVEGDHPGSTYYAAELKSDMDTANAAAAELEMPFRFCGEESATAPIRSRQEIRHG